MTVEGAGGGVLDQEIRNITIPDLTAARPALSTPRVYAVRTPREFQAIAGNAAAVPPANREFPRTMRLLIRFDSYGPGGEVPAPTAALLNSNGQKFTDVPVTAATAGGTHQIDMSLATIPAGEYVIEITTKSASGDTAKELVAFASAVQTSVGLTNLGFGVSALSCPPCSVRLFAPAPGAPSDFRRPGRKTWTRRSRQLQRELSQMQAELAALRAGARRARREGVAQSREPLLAALDARLRLNRFARTSSGGRAARSLHGSDDAHGHREHPAADFYELVNAAIPPAELFPRAIRSSRTSTSTSIFAGAPRSRSVSGVFSTRDIVAGILAPALHDRFRAAVVEHYAETAGGDFGTRAAAIPHRGFAGRLHLRRPGYHLKPHLDPKRVVITGLVYFARPGDSEAYGTQLFRVGKPFTASTMGKFYPEGRRSTRGAGAHGAFRPNTLLAFVNSKAAHGATLPADAPLRERYAYQFYVKPRDGDLKKLLLELPPESRTNWRASWTKKSKRWTERTYHARHRRRHDSTARHLCVRIRAGWNRRRPGSARAAAARPAHHPASRQPVQAAYIRRDDACTEDNGRASARRAARRRQWAVQCAAAQP
jgi:hypothetical protein